MSIGGLDALVHLSTAGVSLLLELTDAALPAVVHWGAALGEVNEVEARAVRAAQRPVTAPSQVDAAVRVSLLPEHHTGFVGRPGLSGARAGRSWSTKFLVQKATLDGEPLASFAASGAGIVEVIAVDEEAALELFIAVELLPSGLVRTRAELTNRDTEPYALDQLTMAYPVPAQAVELLDFAGRWGRERVPQRTEFTMGTRLRENRRGRTGADSATLLHAGVRGFGFAAGAVWSVHTAWSGNHTHYAERTFDGHRLLGGGELLLPGEVVLRDGESYSTPWVYGCYADGLDAAARRFHRYLRARPGHVSVDRPVTLNVWEAVYFDQDLDTLLRLADRAAALGVERFVLDDGWFGSRRDDHSGLGDWTVSEQVWPQGLHPLVDRVTGLGMQFGLWFEPEMVNADSDLARAHPEWVMAARKEWPKESRHQQVLDLAVPECFEHILRAILAILEEYQIAYIKWDHNRDLIEAGDQTDGGRPAVHRQTAAFYRMLAAIKQAHPRLEIESCSSGGARVDLGVMELADRIWVSDCIDPLERQTMLRWSMQLLPPEMLGSHIASNRSHTTGRMHDLNFRAATAIFGHLGIEWNVLELTERAEHELSEWVSFYQQHRALLLGGDLVRMDDPGDDTFVHAVVAPDQSAALVAYVLIGYPLEMPGPRIRLRGLDPARRYHVTPVFVGTQPSGVRPPQWWGPPSSEPTDHAHALPEVVGPVTFPGSVFSGGTLEHVGVVPPIVHPDQVVLLHVRAVP